MSAPTDASANASSWSEVPDDYSDVINFPVRLEDPDMPALSTFFPDLDGPPIPTTPFANSLPAFQPAGSPTSPPPGSYGSHSSADSALTTYHWPDLPDDGIIINGWNEPPSGYLGYQDPISPIPPISIPTTDQQPLSYMIPVAPDHHAPVPLYNPVPSPQAAYDPAPATPAPLSPPPCDDPCIQPMNIQRQSRQQGRDQRKRSRSHDPADKDYDCHAPRAKKAKRTTAKRNTMWTDQETREFIQHMQGSEEISWIKITEEAKRLEQKMARRNPTSLKDKVRNMKSKYEKFDPNKEYNSLDKEIIEAFRNDLNDKIRVASR